MIPTYSSNSKIKHLIAVVYRKVASLPQYLQTLKIPRRVLDQKQAEGLQLNPIVQIVVKTIHLKSTRMNYRIAKTTNLQL
jgi:hypothetical protein